MKFLLDVCAASISLRKFLVDSGHDVVSAVDIGPSLLDEELLDISLRQGRILITKDKDFGELVFVRHLAHATIIRFVEMTANEELNAMQELLKEYKSELEKGAIVVITRNRVRIRT